MRGCFGMFLSLFLSVWEAKAHGNSNDEEQEARQEERISWSHINAVLILAKTWGSVGELDDNSTCIAYKQLRLRPLSAPNSLFLNRIIIIIIFFFYFFFLFFPNKHEKMWLNYNSPNSHVPIIHYSYSLSLLFFFFFFYTSTRLNETTRTQTKKLSVTVNVYQLKMQRQKLISRIKQIKELNEYTFHTDI